jgi:ribosomal protein S13
MGTNKHIYGADLNLQVDFDIKRLKKIKAYKGVRHAAGQPVRGQRTKSHFRANKKKSGMSSKDSKPTQKMTPKPGADKSDKKK